MSHTAASTCTSAIGINPQETGVSPASYGFSSLRRSPVAAKVAAVIGQIFLGRITVDPFFNKLHDMMIQSPAAHPSA